MPLSRDAGVPPTSTYGQQGSVSDGNGDSQFAGRVFSSWAAASGPYTALSLNVNLSCTNDHGTTHGYCYAQYSTDGGATWTMLANATGSQAQNTYTAAISASTNFANLQVAVCSDASDAAPLGTITATTLQVWDVWTNGTTSGSPGSNSDPAFGFAP